MPCIYDVKCLSSAAEESTIFDYVEQDLTGKTFEWNAFVRYSCPRGKEFQVNPSTVYEVFDYRCQWNDKWEPDLPQLPPCECA